MEKLKGKHDHKLTDLLKVLIFAIIMLAPIFAVASKCLYVACNKNAKDSYSGTTTQIVEKTLQTNQVASYDDLIVGNVYKLKFYNNALDEWFYNDIGDIYFDFAYYFYSIDMSDFLVDEVAYVSHLPLGNLISYSNIVFINADELYLYLTFINNLDFNFDITINCVGKLNENSFCIFKMTDDLLSDLSVLYVENYISECPQEYLQYVLQYEEIQTSTLDNVFYNAVDELANKPLFAWTKNTGIYSAINTMTKGLELGNNNVLAVLLTYWALMTAIYIVFDIIIFLFTKMTHLLQ